MSAHPHAAALWRQSKIPVLYRQGGSAPLLLRLPYAEDNRVWVRGDHQRKPKWVFAYKCWQTPKAWFDDLIQRCCLRYGCVYVIQPYREKEVCAPACWEAQGFTCECSCMGANHGQGRSGTWCIVSDAFAVQWGEKRLACRLIESHSLRKAA